VNISFDGKVALVTGAGAGMGLAMAQAFAEAGAAIRSQTSTSRPCARRQTRSSQRGTRRLPPAAMSSARLTWRPWLSRPCPRSAASTRNRAGSSYIGQQRTLIRGQQPQQQRASVLIEFAPDRAPVRRRDTPCIVAGHRRRHAAASSSSSVRLAREPSA
jgi:hypothetical protein